jgi:hypothetical protein
MDPNLNQPASPEQLPPTQAPNEIEETKRVSKKLILLVSFILAILIPASIYVYSKNKNTVSYNSTVTPTTAPVSPAPTATPELEFSNTDGGYSFKTPSGWKTEINQYASKNTLFGPSATSVSGLGGIEVVSGQPTLVSYLQIETEAVYSASKDITVDGISGVERTYTAAGSRSGKQVVLFSKGIIYNIYINSSKPEDLNNFNAIINTFKFTNSTLNENSTTTDSISITTQVQNFYKNWLIYTDSPATKATKLKDQGYLTNNAVTSITQAVGLDLATCSQNPLTFDKYDFGTPQIQGNTAFMDIKGNYGSGVVDAIKLTIVKSGTNWMIDSITCPK